MATHSCMSIDDLPGGREIPTLSDLPRRWWYARIPRQVRQVPRRLVRASAPSVPLVARASRGLARAITSARSIGRRVFRPEGRPDAV